MTRIFFFHIPKTAGTSVSQFFANRVPKTRVHIGGPQAKVQAAVQANPTAPLYYAAHMAWEEYARIDFRHRAFTFLRDPRARLISSYYFVRHSKAPEEGMAELSRATRRYDLAGWLQYCLDGAATDMGQNNGSDNAYLRILLGRSQVIHKGRLDYAMDGPEMALACQRLRLFDCVGLVEDFATSLATIAAAMQVPPPEEADLVPRNRTDAGGRIERDPITDRMEDAITELCRYDQALYDYGRSLYEAQRLAYGMS